MTHIKPISIEPGEETRTATQLVQQIQAGSTKAEGAMVERYSSGLLAFLRRRTGNLALAEDLHQEVFQIVLIRLRKSGLEQPEKLAAFLHSTANNLIIAHFRKAARSRIEIDPDLEDSAVPPEQGRQILRRERALIVRRLIAELKPKRDRELLFRFYIAEQEKKQICSDLGLSQSHFKKVLHRARSRFRALFIGSQKRQRLQESLAATRRSATRPNNLASGPEEDQSE